MSTLLNPVPLGEAAGESLVDLGGTADTEKLQESVVSDCRVNGVEFSAKEPAAPALKAEAPRTDFSNIVGGPKPLSMG
jgi:hypothetical protein